MPVRPHSTRPSAKRGFPRRAFTLIEVMLASVVLLFGITSAILVLQRGLQSIDTARNTTNASQIMQSELERLRLKSWAQIQALQDANSTAVAVPAVSGMANTTITCTRTIRDLKTDMKEITLVATWRGYDGLSHTLRLITRYGKSGLYDYFYTSH
ncbi:MAG: prepilin-type N-terminal cleavage/methylation domain-containing protein [Opitutaceae bacterium]|jgi:prepilin-type N-terminal cleavage/methylation domain-containing protein